MPNPREVLQLFNSLKPLILGDPDIMETGGLNAPIGAPYWKSDYPRQIGANIYVAFAGVPRAVNYQVWRNSVAAFAGAVLVAELGTATVANFPCNITRNSQINTINPGAESGDFSGYIPNYWMVAFTIEDTIVLSGAHSFKFYPFYGESAMRSVDVAILPAETYKVQIPINITNGHVAANNDMWGYVEWLDSDHDLLFGGLELIHHWEDVTSGWESITAYLTSPAGAAYVRFFFDCDRGLIATDGEVITGYLDDLLIEGPSPISVDKQLYGLRALDEDGNESNFSAWLTATPAGAALGDRSSAHLELLPSGDVRSSLTGSPPIFNIGAYGKTDTGWDVPLNDSAPATWETWTRTSATEFTVAYNATARYIAGVVLRWKQGGGYNYGRVVSSSYSAPDTTVTVTVISGSLTASTITDNYYSRVMAPEGLAISSTLGAEDPLADGTADPGTAIVASREDHVHPATAASGFATGDYKSSFVSTATAASGFATGDYKSSFVSTATTGWLLCDATTIGDSSSGADHTGDDYHALYDVIQATFGGTYNWAAHGAVNLPDFRGRAIVGVGTHADVNAITDNDGLTVANRSPKHTHTYTDVVNHVHPMTTTGTEGGTDGWALLGEAIGHKDSPNPEGGTATGTTATGTAPYGTAYIFIKT